MLLTRENGCTSPREIQIGFYTRIYNGGAKSDSPDRSRVSLARRAKPHFESMEPGSFVVDLGAGRQIFERHYFQAFGKPDCRIISVDIADIQKSRLLEGNSTRVTHTRADGAQLPFRSEQLDGVVSNMALDFMPNDAIEELFRVLKAGSHGLINLHHPALIPDNLDELLQMRKKSQGEEQVLNYWDYLRQNRILTSDPQEIARRFKSHGFQLTSGVREVGDGRDKWWEADIYKPRVGGWGGFVDKIRGWVREITC